MNRTPSKALLRPVPKDLGDHKRPQQVPRPSPANSCWRVPSAPEIWERLPLCWRRREHRPAASFSSISWGRRKGRVTCPTPAWRRQHGYRLLEEPDGALVGGRAEVHVFLRRRQVVMPGYDRIGLVSDAEADAMRALAVRLRDDVVARLKANYPDLLKAP